MKGKKHRITTQHPLPTSPIILYIARQENDQYDADDPADHPHWYNAFTSLTAVISWMTTEGKLDDGMEHVRVCKIELQPSQFDLMPRKPEPPPMVTLVPVVTGRKKRRTAVQKALSRLQERL